MSLPELLNREITIIRRTGSGTTDRYGNQIPDEELVEAVGELQQRQRSEPAAAGELGVSDWLLVLSAGTEIDTGDGVIVDGQVFEVIGDPWHARNPRKQVESHVEATLKRTAGAESGS